MQVSTSYLLNVLKSSGPSGLALMVGILDQSEWLSTCHSTNRQLGTLTDLSERSVQSILKVLVDSGLVEVGIEKNTRRRIQIRRPPAENCVPPPQNSAPPHPAPLYASAGARERAGASESVSLSLSPLEREKFAKWVRSFPEFANLDSAANLIHVPTYGPDLVASALEVCLSQGKFNPRYLAGVLRNLAAEGAEGSKVWRGESAQRPSGTRSVSSPKPGRPSRYTNALTEEDWKSILGD